MKPAKPLALTLCILALVSLFVSTLAQAGITQLKNDNDDFFQGATGGRIQGDVDGAVFAPPADLFPITIQSVEFAFHRPQDANHLTDSVELRVQIYSMDGASPGDVLAESEPQIVSGNDRWLSISLEPPLTLNEPVSFMAAVKWESGDNDVPSVSLATDSTLDAPLTKKDQINLYFDANTVLRPADCPIGEFCSHSQFWANPRAVGFNMIRVTIDSPQIPTPTPITPTSTPVVPTATLTPTVTLTPTAQPTSSSRTKVFLPSVMRNFDAPVDVIEIGSGTNDAVGYTLTSGDGLRGRCWPGGAGNNLWVGREPADERGIMRSLLRFDLGAVPADAFVQQATLQMFVVEVGAGDPTPMPVSVHHVTQPWAGCPTWRLLANAVGPAWGSQTAGVEMYNVDVTALVRAWLDGELPNYGLILRGDEEQVGQMRGFIPTTSPNVDLRPRLVIKVPRF